MIDYEKHRKKRLRRILIKRYGVSLKQIRGCKLDNPLMSGLARKVMINEALLHGNCVRNRITRPKYTNINKTREMLYEKSMLAITEEINMLKPKKEPKPAQKRRKYKSQWHFPDNTYHVSENAFLQALK